MTVQTYPETTPNFRETLHFARFAKKDCGLDSYNLRELLEKYHNEDNDFEAGGYRFIHKEDIDQIMQDELSNDEYILGCFNASFLAGVLGIDQDVIEAMQKAEAYEAVGKLILSLDKLEELQADYVSADGYGHHFSGYDGNEHEIGDYYAFRIN